MALMTQLMAPMMNENMAEQKGRRSIVKTAVHDKDIHI